MKVLANRNSKCCGSQHSLIGERAKLEPEEQMPKYGSLKADDIKGLVAYIRTLKK